MIGGLMECIYYRCKTCGFTHQVPSYWSGHSPEEEYEMPHLNLETKDMCSDISLQLIKE